MPPAIAIIIKLQQANIKLQQEIKNMPLASTAYFAKISSSSLLTTVEYKIDYISKIKTRTRKKSQGYKNPFQNIAHLLRLTSFLTIFGR